ncbi:HD-GYP domain-containing protein [Chromobacterium vaccinii]|uniref:Phosphohydrolase n=1 Tax=Chromobacterium vaccinii TaxID=1108595 RepID=A0A1D9LEN3_9NEIS|nr:HD domain-containing phosphohydrolase [Chromobacterium vaccinii]AOZ49731.1 phosphohydrolase [Chromobacterium vaccinii]MBX9349257.1 phosphohydrolase [Chromobacterium vaccinii]MCD4499912.1 phosphohydrolase [Chromobacterium vaccinii]NHQ80313.1 phosphohydrolase [Chromobacterium vaccinii]
MTDSSAKVKLPRNFLRAGQQAPVDVYAKNGVLLLKRGLYVLTEEQRDRLAQLGHGESDEVAAKLERERLERAAQREKEAEQQRNSANPLQEMAFLLRRAEGVLQHGLAVRDLAGSLLGMAEGLLALSRRHPDGVLASVFLLPFQCIGSAQSVHVAAVLAVLGRRLGLSDAELRPMLGAALSMNLAVTGLLNQLAAQSAPMDLAQQEAMFAHPALGSAMLREAGVDDEYWHLLVQQQHEQQDGSGYPQGLAGDEIETDALLLQMVDLVCGCVHNPQPQLPALVLGSLFRGELGGFPPQHVSLLVKEMGIYPPGSFVRLASNEVAVVTHRGDKANTPKVAALRKLDGPPYADPLLRDSRQPAYHVMEPVSAAVAAVKPAYLYKLWYKP